MFNEGIRREYIGSSDRACSNKTVAVFVAWPYAKELHLGHAAAYVPADVIARYSRAQGSHVLMVSGTDEYGTPTLVAAEKIGISPEQFVDEMSMRARRDLRSLGISYDWFTRTTSPLHQCEAQNFFLQLVHHGYLTLGKMRTAFEQGTSYALPDRYIEGVHKSCGGQARGDQCDVCGQLIDPEDDLIDPRSIKSGNIVDFRESSHFFLRLDLCQPALSDWILQKQSQWKTNVFQHAYSWIQRGLKPRAITRDLSWGIPLPQNYDDNFLLNCDMKVLYVWFEALIGYLSASKEWANNIGNTEAWKKWWCDPSATHYYVMGKDNIGFHTIMWPAMLMGYNFNNNVVQLHFPDQIVSVEHLLPSNSSSEAVKFSTSRGNAILIHDLLAHYEVDQLRYYLISAGPESTDVRFSYEELDRRSNALANNWGNLVHRVLTMTHRYCDGVVPGVSHDDLEVVDKMLLGGISEGFSRVGTFIEQAALKQALDTAMSFVSQVNAYLNHQQPWALETVSSNDPKTRQAQIIYTALSSIDHLVTMLMPFLPVSSQRVLNALGYSDNVLGNIVEREVEYPDKRFRVLTGNYDASRGVWQPTMVKGGHRRVEDGLILFSKKH